MLKNGGDIFMDVGRVLFAPEGTGGGSGIEPNEGSNSNNAQTELQNQPSQASTIDYEKLVSMLRGKLSVTEDTFLENYMKQQGLSGDELEQAIRNFKDEKAKNTPDIGVIQSQLEQAQAAVAQAKMENIATLTCIHLGLDTKTIPYVLKMADFSKVKNSKGEINEDTLKNALNQVLEDVPALKPSNTQGVGFRQIGGTGNFSTASGEDEVLSGIFGNKK